MVRQWTLLARVDGGNAYFDRGAWEMLRAQVVAVKVGAVSVVGQDREVVAC